MPGSGDAGRVRGQRRGQQVPVVPQRGARRHVLRGRRGVAPAATGLLLRPARRRSARPEVMPLPPLGIARSDHRFAVARRPIAYLSFLDLIDFRVASLLV